MTNRNEIKMGDKVRCFDFEPRPGHPELDNRYVEGNVIGFQYDGAVIEVEVTKDMVCKPGDRETITTPLESVFGEWDGRITVIN